MATGACDEPAAAGSGAASSGAGSPSALVEALADRLVIDPARTALVTVDCHRGHLDPAVATMPVDPSTAARIVTAVARMCDAARQRGVPVVHVILETIMLGGRVESMANPFWREVEAARQSLTPGRKSTVVGHNLTGSVQTELMSEVGPAPGDTVIRTKRRLSVFRETDLELVLHTLGVDTLLLVGINTNTCVMCAAFEAFNRDLRVVVVRDAVASMYGDDLHRLGLENVARCLGWVVTADEAIARMDARIAAPAGATAGA
ncbi:MAG: isochorismatase family protein [Acidimicrobiales bacterium]